MELETWTPSRYHNPTHNSFLDVNGQEAQEARAEPLRDETAQSLLCIIYMYIG